MSSPLTRRGFVAGTVGAGALAGLGDFSFLGALPALGAAAAPRTVRLSSDVEPLARLIEDTPRKALLEKVAGEIRNGASYQQLLAAVFLAGVRGIQPRPVGFKFHAVLVINSAHLASQAAADSDRWLPLFWALDYFKSSQAENKAKSGWMMSPPAEAKLPPAAKARERFVAAMDDWDLDGADRAASALTRCAGANEVFGLLWRYGARDFRDIGHKAIYVANAYRTLGAIGWRHAEPVVRSLAYALLEHEGNNPAKRDDPKDRPGRDNLKTAEALKGVGRGGKPDPAAAADLLAALRTASAKDGAAKAAELLKKGVHPESVWDGLFLAAAELLARQPGIVGLHCVTTANALHYAYQTSGDDVTRRFVTLQAASFLPLFREAMKGRGKLPRADLDKLEKTDLKSTGAKAVEEVLAAVSKDRTVAARKTLALLEQEPAQVEALLAGARRLIFTKGTNSHDYKFSSAALEDYYHLSPAWRARFAAASMYNLKGSGDADNGLVRRTRAALAKS